MQSNNASFKRSVTFYGKFVVDEMRQYLINSGDIDNALRGYGLKVT